MTRNTFFFFVLFLCACVHASSSPSPSEDMRLISLSEGHAQWMWRGDVETLMEKRIHFIDITDHTDEGEEATVVPQPDPLPNQAIHKVYVDSLLKQLSPHNLKATLQNLTAFETRYYTSDTGVEAAKWIASQYEGYAQDRDDVTIELFTHKFAQPSVIVTIPGLGPNKDQFVVLGAHEDSVGSTSKGRSPGADDDGSGTVDVLEIFRVLVAADHYPDRTLKFIAYAGEEAGLLGSQDIATAFKNNDSDVFAVLQLDMTGYGGIDTDIGIVTDYTHPELSEYVKILVDTYSLLTWNDTKCGYGCSDHASWTKAGYRAAFPFETTFNIYNPYIHSANDVIANINLDRVLEFAKIGLGFVVELGGITIRP